MFLHCRGAALVVAFILNLRGLEGCALANSRPAWSLYTEGVAPRSRYAREVSLSERGNCDGGVALDIPAGVRIDSTKRVDDLIALIKREHLDAYLIPSSDEHLSEYVSEFDKRMKFVTGFSGSDGTVVILANGQRALWTDGRYFLQADEQLDCHWLLMKEGNDGVPTILEWLKSSLPANSVLGADPRLVSAMEWLDYEKSLKETSIKFKPVVKNLVDELRPGREASTEPVNPIKILETQFSGMKWEDKVVAVREELKKNEADMIVITALDEIAWLFNLRGGDIPNHPVFRSYAIIDKDKVRLFLEKKIGAEVDLYLNVNNCDQVCVEIADYKEILGTLNALTSLDTVKKVILPSKYSYSGGASYAIYYSVPEEKRIFIVSPVLLMKAQKNAVEVQGMKNAHIKDAVALIDFLSFLEEEIHKGNKWTELSAAARLEEFRAEQEHFHSLSFETISAFGSNGAIVHYSPTPETDKVITNQSLYLLDSGGQYKDGTTDVTRTLHYGRPTALHKEAYTRVLMGAIDVAILKFPKGTKDTRVDVLARRALYDVGLDFQHGTGHGIGMFLYVHEAPTQMRIYGTEEHDLLEGYFLSDEPGYYKAGDFGIRLETIVTVVPKKTKYTDFPMLGFEPVTLVPFEPKLIDYKLLDNNQCGFLNWYHEQIRQQVGPQLDKQNRSRAKAYMMQRTESVNCAGTGKEKETGSLKREEEVMQQKTVKAQQSSVPVSDFESHNYADRTLSCLTTMTVALSLSLLLSR